MTATRLEPTAAGIATAADCILDGGVVVAPSDTNLALTLDPWDEAAIERAFRIKNREPTDPLTLFIRDPDDWREWARTDRGVAVDALVEAFWPGPLNIVLPKTDAVPDRVVAGGETVALGCLGNPTWRRLAAAVDQPLCMTSANLTGQADDQLVDLDLAVEQVVEPPFELGLVDLAAGVSILERLDRIVARGRLARVARLGLLVVAGEPDCRRQQPAEADRECDPEPRHVEREQAERDEQDQPCRHAGGDLLQRGLVVGIDDGGLGIAHGCVYAE